MGSYQEWLERQNELTIKALELVESIKLKVTMICEEGKPSFLRLFFGDEFVDFFPKSIKSRWIRNIWLCKVSDVLSNPKRHWLVYCEKEEYWAVVLRDTILSRATKRESDFKGRKEYFIVDPELLRGAKHHFSRIKKRFLDQQQRRLNEYQ